MNDEEKRFKSFNEITGGSNLDIIPSAYSLRSPKDNTYFELSTEELEGLSLDINDIRTVELIHVAPYKRLIRIRANEKYYILLDSRKPTNEYRCYELLKRYDIQTLPVYAMAQTSEWSALLMEDLHLSDSWRLASLRDTADYEVGAALGRWYKQLHEKGIEVLKDSDAEIFEREYDQLNPKTILWTAEKLGLESYDVFQLAVQYIEAIKKKAYQFDETVLYNDFDYENLAVSKDGKEAVMFDYHLMGRGYRYNDIRNVMSGLRDSAIEGFENSYGKFNEQEKIVDDVLAPLFSMLVAAQRKTLPKWVKPTIKDVKIGKLEEKLRLLIQSL